MVKALKFKFEASQPHQKEAIESVVGMFKGFSQDIAGFQLEYDVVPNIQDFYDFDEEWLYGNYQEVINTNNKIKESAGFQPDLPMNASLQYEDGFQSGRYSKYRDLPHQHSYRRDSQQVSQSY